MSGRVQVFTACVIGGGFSGASTAMHLLDAARERGVPMHVQLIDAQGSAGTGAAYGTIDVSHLLNVPAGSMSARPDVPQHFLEWSKVHLPHATAADFLPRMLFGRYVRESLAHAASEAA
ncbi:MAG: FAD-dependent oxidoreductase, partial [Planctomycetes bacterium]|nr:FAD-dependent oxidoreductase [Planctomycetota bacterium]